MSIKNLGSVERSMVLSGEVSPGMMGRAYHEFMRLVLDSVDSPQTKRTYGTALAEFFTWHSDQGRPPLVKATVNAYKEHLRARELAASTINVKLSAVRALARELADNDIMPEQTANGIARVRGAKQEGTRAGTWLTKEQAQELLDAPNTKTLKGKRDRAILAVALGCALRRAELAALTVEDVQQREGRWLIVDIIGKRGKVRSVPMPSWVKDAVDKWTAAAGITSGSLWMPMRKGDKIADHEFGRGMSTQAVWRLVEHYTKDRGYKIAPHDLRRTSAKLMLAGGAPIEQISRTLGHSSVQTTETYLGVTLELHDAATDRIPLK